MEVWKVRIPSICIRAVHSLMRFDPELHLVHDVAEWLDDNDAQAVMEPVFKFTHLTPDKRSISAEIDYLELVFDDLDKATLFKLRWC